MAEPLLIAAAALVGALIGAFYHFGYGDNPMLAAAGAMAGIAANFGLIRFVTRPCRARTKMLGGIVIRVSVMLLCAGAEISGLACWCDDVSQAVYLPRITFEQGGLPH